MRKWKSTKVNRRRKKETWWKLLQQVIVMLWMNDISCPDPDREIMGCNRDLENIQKNINDVKNKMKNITDVLGRV
ncbi:hypothetical protein AB205_0136020 [Aquarana catesbeiana]|uniref:Uncharacterized protein n=1 Tax=Aquarana catesbeiana TaxID=8400 RepID=A0A2G9Q031_AQUCT|nr:hypothetical protein AB205_0136020 [Aquarana catesbeiana]